MLDYAVLFNLVRYIIDLIRLCYSICSISLIMILFLKKIILIRGTFIITYPISFALTYK